ncbi:protein tofu-2-like [Physella acuta]|uniref:protein tofu-2-like n=1 Tax=Physella acuta TaxID=109671 RepID=UPI0027DC0716|nr:protein tofu-2-like [Physella acuta]
MQKRFYTKFQKMPFEEDATHEFKGHKNICKEELPKWTLETSQKKGSRKPISRNLCGFLNTGVGGTIYCGVVDNGKIMGLKLSQYQKDHVVGSLHDLMTRYVPPVAPHRYKIKFVPVIAPKDKEEEMIELANFDSKEIVDQVERKQLHTFRTPHYCWCDLDSKARCENGIIISDYIIEITIHPWDPDDNRNQGLGKLINLHPIHADEEGRIYFRRQSSLIRYNATEIATLSHFEAKSRYDQKISELKKEISLAKKEIEDRKAKSSQVQHSPNF